MSSTLEELAHKNRVLARKAVKSKPVKPPPKRASTVSLLAEIVELLRARGLGDIGSGKTFVVTERDADGKIKAFRVE